MSRLILSLMFAFGFTVISYADPIKKAPKADQADKLAKECVEAFIKAIVDGKPDDAIKLCSTPILEPSGNVSDSLESIKAAASRKLPDGFEMKVTEAIALDKFNEWSKKKDMKELNNEQLKQVGELIGKEGRIVIIETKLDGMAQSRNFLVRNKDGKATIAGVVRPER